MKFTGRAAALCLSLALLTTAAAPLSAYAAEVPQVFAEDTPESTNEDYTVDNVATFGEKKTAATIYWTHGITAPEIKDKPQEALAYVADFAPKQGWFDLDSEDSAAAAGANLMAWWMAVNAENISAYLSVVPGQPDYTDVLADPQGAKSFTALPETRKPEDNPFFAYFKTAAGEKTYAPHKLADLFINGYTLTDKENSPMTFDPKGEGYFFPVFDMIPLTYMDPGKSDLLAMGKTLRQSFNSDCAMTLGLKDSKDQIFYVNLWGAEFDPDSKLTAIYITDSADKDAKGSMLRAAVQEKDGALLVQDPRDPMTQVKWGNLSILYSGDALFRMYNEEDHTPPKWGKTTYEWSEDNLWCTAVRTDENDPENKEYLDGMVKKEETKAPTHQEKGVMTYTATFNGDWAETQVKTAEIPVLQADPPADAPDGPADGPVISTPAPVKWKATTYTWADDFSACTARRERVDDPKIFEEAEAKEIQIETSRKPTTTMKGQTSYTAVFTQDWTQHQTQTLDNIPTLEPEWGEVKYEWSGDFKSCTATRTALNDTNNVETAIGKVETEVIKQPTETEKGKTRYTASFTEDWAKTQSVTSENIPTLDAGWNEPTYTWEKNNSLCKAVRTRKSDPSKKEEALAAVKVELTKEPTCLEKGESTYTAVFEESWAKTQVKVVEDQEKLQPNWGEVTYEWDEDHFSCVATRVCKNEPNHVETAKARVHSKQTKAPTTKEKGETTYTAEFKEDWAKNQKVTLADIDKIVDEWEKPTYTWSNNNSKCVAKRVNAKNSDVVETATAKVTQRQTKAPTETQKGETTYTAAFKEGWAKDQTKVVADVPVLGESGDQWTETVYEWSKDHSRCSASRTKKNDKSNVEIIRATVEEKVVKEATCDQKGETVYTARFNKNWARTQTETVETEMLKHELEKVDMVPATASQDGIQTHYECKNCGRFFTDAAATKEVTREELRIPKPQVSGGNAVLAGVPVKENTVSLTPEKLTQALNQNPDIQGVTVTIGDTSVAIHADTLQEILKETKDAQELLLQVGKTDFMDMELTQEQGKFVQQNPGSLYRVALHSSKGGKLREVPLHCTVMVPYQGQDTVQVYRAEEKGGYTKTASQYANGFLAFNADDGFYLAAEQEPTAAKAPKKVGTIILTVVLVISGLGVLGIGGFLIYKKYMEDQEFDDEPMFDKTPRFDAAAKERITGKPQAPKPQTPVKTPVEPPKAQPAAPRAPQAPAEANKVQQPAKPTIAQREAAKAAQKQAPKAQPAAPTQQPPVQTPAVSQKPLTPEELPTVSTEGMDDLEELKEWLDMEE